MQMTAQYLSDYIDPDFSLHCQEFHNNKMLKTLKSAWVESIGNARQ